MGDWIGSDWVAVSCTSCLICTDSGTRQFVSLSPFGIERNRDNKEPFHHGLRRNSGAFTQQPSKTNYLDSIELVNRMVRAISDNNNDSTSGQRTSFTPRSATKMLPLVRRIVADMLQLSRSIDAQREQLRGIDKLTETNDQPDYREELSDIRGSLTGDERRLEICFSELAALGLEAHQPFDGSIDFPAVFNRRRVRLCWRPEDERVEHWHEVGKSVHERKKIDPKLFGVESLN